MLRNDYDKYSKLLDNIKMFISDICLSILNNNFEITEYQIRCDSNFGRNKIKFLYKFNVNIHVHNAYRIMCALPEPLTFNEDSYYVFTLDNKFTLTAELLTKKLLDAEIMIRYKKLNKIITNEYFK
jgi:hypothetical protein